MTRRQFIARWLSHREEINCLLGTAPLEQLRCDSCQIQSGALHRQRNQHASFLVVCGEASEWLRGRVDSMSLARFSLTSMRSNAKMSIVDREKRMHLRVAALRVDFLMSWNFVNFGRRIFLVQSLMCLLKTR